ncbi:hypothetical protein BJ165DRAFT_1596289, partial [Panaeolus papilionaceus]
MSILMSSSQPTVLPLILIHIVSQINLIMIPHPHHAYDRRPQRPDQRTLSLHLLSVHNGGGSLDDPEERVREIARSEYGDGMSACFIFTAMRFYPVNPVSSECVFGSYVLSLSYVPSFSYFRHSFLYSFTHIHQPLFKIRTPNPPIPTAPRPLHTSAIGARTKKYIKLSTMNVQTTTTPFVKHEWIKDGREVMFEMGREAEAWGEVRWEHGWEVEAGEEGVRDELREL